MKGEQAPGFSGWERESPEPGEDARKNTENVWGAVALPRLRPGYGSQAGQPPDSEEVSDADEPESPDPGSPSGRFGGAATYSSAYRAGRESLPGGALSGSPDVEAGGKPGLLPGISLPVTAAAGQQNMRVSQIPPARDGSQDPPGEPGVRVTAGPDETLAGAVCRMMASLRAVPETRQLAQAGHEPAASLIRDLADRVLPVAQAVLAGTHPLGAAAMAAAGHIIQAWEALNSPGGCVVFQVPVPVGLGPLSLSVGTTADDGIAAPDWPLSVQVSLPDGLPGLWDIQLQPGTAPGPATPQPRSEPAEPILPPSQGRRAPAATPQHDGTAGEGGAAESPRETAREAPPGRPGSRPPRPGCTALPEEEPSLQPAVWMTSGGFTVVVIPRSRAAGRPAGRLPSVVVVYATGSRLALIAVVFLEDDMLAELDWTLSVVTDPGTGHAALQVNGVTVPPAAARGYGGQA